MISARMGSFTVTFWIGFLNEIIVELALFDFNSKEKE